MVAFLPALLSIGSALGGMIIVSKEILIAIKDFFWIIIFIGAIGYESMNFFSSGTTLNPLLYITVNTIMLLSTLWIPMNKNQFLIMFPDLLMNMMAGSSITPMLLGMANFIRLAIFLALLMSTLSFVWSWFNVLKISSS